MAGFIGLYNVTLMGEADNYDAFIHILTESIYFVFLFLHFYFSIFILLFSFLLSYLYSYFADLRLVFPFHFWYSDFTLSCNLISFHIFVFFSQKLAF